MKFGRDDHGPPTTCPLVTFMIQSEISEEPLDGLPCNAVQTFMVFVHFGDPLTFHYVSSLGVILWFFHLPVIFLKFTLNSTTSQTAWLFLFSANLSVYET